ncbi:hypothetical protein GW17_00024646 [Ensete ventricosum]|nr:hypothetical protein GW17_00024646 [Ensete ventricosum]
MWLSGRGGVWPPTRSLMGSTVVSSMLVRPPTSSVPAIQIALKHFKTRYPKLEVDEDPFMEFPLDAEVPAPTMIPFNDHPAIRPALPPPS